MRKKSSEGKNAGKKIIKKIKTQAAQTLQSFTSKVKNQKMSSKSPAAKTSAASSRHAGKSAGAKPERKRAKQKRASLPVVSGQLPGPMSIHPARNYSGELPFSYNQTLLVLLVRDPYWAYGYWDFSAQTWDWIQDFFRTEPRIRVILRIHDLDRGGYDDLDVQLEAKNWYLHLARPNTSFEAELGLLDSHGKFHLIAKSNRIRTPRDTPSDVIDPHWGASEFNELYKLSGGGKTGHGSEFFSMFRKR